MRRKSFVCLYQICLLIFFHSVFSSLSLATDLVKLNAANWDEYVPQGKEVDAIYGDYVLRNDKVVAVIAAPSPLRNANLTIRDIGGFVLDFTRRNAQNDQLSCYYPLGNRFHFHSEKRMMANVDGKVSVELNSLSGKSISLSIQSSTGPEGQTATVTYNLVDGQEYLSISHKVTKGGEPVPQKNFTDSFRADRTFKFATALEGHLFTVNDDWFRQGYGLLKTDATIKGNRAAASITVDGDNTERKLFCADSLPGVLGLAQTLSGTKTSTVTCQIEGVNGPVNNSLISLNSDKGKLIGTARTDSNGKVSFALPNGTYVATIETVGQSPQKRSFGVLNQRTVFVRVKYGEAPPTIVARVVDEKGGEIPCKVAFIGKNGTPTFDLGPESAANPVKNLYYSHNGKFELAVPAGEYDVIISRGPEYDAEFTSVEAVAGKKAVIEATLRRVVKTPGWVSTEYHSHSTPSGDNTSDQRGRVLNLLAEHLEFAPCTEHQRIDSYDPHLNALNAKHLMSTCTGMELTGNPLPLNHQNVFPLIHKPRTQDGGGPRVDPDPVAQIQRVAYWDNKSEKVVQINHPNLIQMTGDANLDGKADAGFKKMFDYVDVMEIHPPQQIFQKPDSLPVRGKRGNVIFNWMQLLNQGYRIVGVVNTDAHYNFHGSGWLRNYVKSSTDDAGKIDTMEMVKNSKAGHVVMTTGPFMEVQLKGAMADEKSAFGPGDDVKLPGGKAKLKIEIQCPNWMDVNKVQVFVNGVAEPDLLFTRRKKADDFANGVMKFSKEIDLNLKEDSHIIVATIGEGLTLSRVMGPQYGKTPPCAVSNPIFVDVDGNGFQANGDKIGSPFLIKKQGGK